MFRTLWEMILLLYCRRHSRVLLYVITLPFRRVGKKGSPAVEHAGDIL